jgi:sialate O-acetylesterase
MKKLIISVLLVLSGTVWAATPVDLSSLPVGVERVEIYLLLGQSNMKGRGAIPATQVEDPLIVNMNMADNQWYVAEHPLHKAGVPDLIDGSDNAGVGPGLDFARGVLSRTNGVRIALIPCAVGGSWINLWQPGQDFYTNAIYRAQKALADAPSGKARIKGVLWLQGESDATEARYAAYEGKLSTLVQSLRTDLSEPELPFIACTIGTFIDSNSYPRVTEINSTLLSLPQRELHTACVDARDITGHIGDNMHYNTDSQIIIGTRYAAQVAAVTAAPEERASFFFSTDFSSAIQPGGLGTAISMSGVLAGGVTVSALTAGSGVINFQIDSTSPAGQLEPPVFASSSAGSNASSNLTQAIANNEYFQVTISSDYAANYGSLRFSMVKQGFAPFAGITVRSSVDSYESDLVVVTDSTSTGVYPASVDLLSNTAFDNQTNVTFRFYLYDAYSGNSARRIGIDDLQIGDGTLSLNSSVQFAPLYSHGSVLQREQTVAIRGGGEPGETLTLTVKSQSKTTVVETNGLWRIELDPEPAGGPFELTVAGTYSSSATLTNIYFGDIWLLCGQSNMEQSLASQSSNFPSYYPQMPDAADDFDDVRCAIIKQLQYTNGPSDEVVLDLPWNRWEAGVLANMSAAGYFFARELNAALDANGQSDVPLGLIMVCKGATAAEQWVSAEALATMGEALIPRADKPASSYYNGMIAPLQDYAVKGVLWYQGEANADTIDRIVQYPLVLRTLVESWRAQWNNPELPFYYMQLAPYQAHSKIPKDGDWAWMRKSQTECLSVSNTAMACIIDSGLQGDIHPPFKDRVGKRLALITLDKTYGIPTVCRGPTVSDVRINGTEVVVTFNDVGGGLQTQAVDSQPNAEEIAEGKPPVSASADELAGFELCGSDKVFYWATDAQIISSNQVRIANIADVASPVAVRYAWQRYPRCNLFNSEGLPAEPFRTDAYAYNTSTGADSTPVAFGSPRYNIRTNQTLLDVNLAAIFRDMEDGSSNLNFSVTGISDSNLVSGATASNQVLRLNFSGTAGASVITVRGLDSSGNHADLSFEVTMGQEYRIWQDEYFSMAELGDTGLVSTVWGGLADPDGDRIPNLLEYALALNPQVSNSAPHVLSLVIEQGSIKARFLASKRALADPFVDVGLQTATNLVSSAGWAVVNAAQTVVQEAGDAELREVVLSGGSGDLPVCFVRVYASRVEN